MRSMSGLLKRTAIGAVGGAIGTAALHALMTASKRWRPQSQAPIRVNPGKHLLQKAESRLPRAVRDRIPAKVEEMVAGSMSFGYGMAFGAAYGAFRSETSSTVADGLMLGAKCWAVGYLGWLPASGVMKPIWEHKPEQIAGPLVQHLVYGLVTVGVFNAIANPSKY